MLDQQAAQTTLVKHVSYTKILLGVAATILQVDLESGLVFSSLLLTCISIHAFSQERMRSLDKLRREVDGQRQKYEKKFRRSEQRLRRAYLGAGFGSSSSSSSDDDDVVPRGKLLEDYQRLALHTERQLRGECYCYLF